jgi:RNA polymerase sigma-70 factor (ECF subfamily)
MTVSLVERAQGGDRDAYERLARDVTPRLFLVASRVLRDTDAAEDAVQQTLVAIWRDLSSLRDPSRFEAWAYRMVVRYCRAEWRRNARSGVRIVDLSDSLVAGGDEIGSVAVRDQLGRAFDRLSHDHRVVIVLHHLLGLSLGEIADIVDVPYGTVASRLHYAMRRMRTSLEDGERHTAPGAQPA